MTQRQLDLAVADATGEDVEEIARRGFSLVDDDQLAGDDDLDRIPLFIDWDNPVVPYESACC